VLRVLMQKGDYREHSHKPSFYSILALHRALMISHNAGRAHLLCRTVDSAIVQ